MISKLFIDTSKGFISIFGSIIRIFFLLVGFYFRQVGKIIKAGYPKKVLKRKKPTNEEIW